MNLVFRRAMLLGGAIWLVATVTIRLAGQFVFRPEPIAVLSAFIVGGVLMALVGIRVRPRISRNARDADAVALGLILPGMFADAVVAMDFRHVYPNLSPALGNDFAALMLWYYAVAALAITLAGRLQGGRDAGLDDGRSGRDRRRDRDKGVAGAA